MRRLFDIHRDLETHSKPDLRDVIESSQKLRKSRSEFDKGKDGGQVLVSAPSYAQLRKDAINQMSNVCPYLILPAAIPAGEIISATSL